MNANLGAEFGFERSGQLDVVVLPAKNESELADLALNKLPPGRIDSSGDELDWNITWNGGEVTANQPELKSSDE